QCCHVRIVAASGVIEVAEVPFAGTGSPELTADDGDVAIADHTIQIRIGASRELDQDRSAADGLAGKRRIASQWQRRVLGITDRQVHAIAAAAKALSRRRSFGTCNPAQPIPRSVTKS